jgi:hypothetical protein
VKADVRLSWGPGKYKKTVNGKQKLPGEAIVREDRPKTENATRSLRQTEDRKCNKVKKAEGCPGKSNKVAKAGRGLSWQMQQGRKGRQRTILANATRS